MSRLDNPQRTPSDNPSDIAAGGWPAPAYPTPEPTAVYSPIAFSVAKPRWNIGFARFWGSGRAAFRRWAWGGMPWGSPPRPSSAITSFGWSTRISLLRLVLEKLQEDFEAQQDAQGAVPAAEQTVDITPQQSLSG